MQAGHGAGGKPAEPRHKKFEVSGQELTLSVGRFVVPIALGGSILAAGTDVHVTFWPFLAFCVLVTGGELTASLARPSWSRPRVLLLQDVFGVLLLIAFARGMDSFAGQALLLVLLTEAAFLLRPRGVALFAPAVYVATMAVSALPGVVDPGLDDRIFALWTTVMVVVIANRISRRDTALVAMAASRARLLADAEISERRERARLAEALHDDALQRIFAARQDLEEGLDTLDVSLMRQAHAGLGEAVDSLRALTKAMHGQRLADAGLRRAVQRLAEDAARRGRFEAEVVIDDEASGDFDEIVVGFVRELVSNVEKHADASKLEIAVRRQGDDIVLEVVDDGVGVSLDRLHRAREDGHLGHATLRDRIETVGGELEIVSAPGDGTAVRVVLGEERLRAQRALGEQLDHDREQGAALLAALQDGFVVIRDGRITEANDRFCAMTGYTRTALLALPAGSVPFWSAEGARNFERLVEKAEGVGEAAGELTLLAADGSRRPVLLSARVARDGRGEEVGTMIVFKDFQALHAGRERLRREQAFLDALVHSFPAALCVTTPALGIVRVNERMCELTGFSEGELLGSELTAPILRKDGRTLAAALDARPLTGLDGRELGQIVVVTPVGSGDRALSL